MVQIANPIYDAVFKYMMDDNEVAKLLLSAIIGEHIEKLTFQPTHLTVPLRESITVLRMDFKALIALKDGTTKTAIIEIQKAKLHTDIMRFRKYLGEQYASKNNSEVVKRTASTNPKGSWTEHRKAYPILSIYFLGHSLEHAKNIPVIKVARTYYDLATGTSLPEKEDFIESLTHDSYVIQIPYVTGNKRTELEQLLQIFDQEEMEDDNLKHILNIEESEIPEQYRLIIRRLRLAMSDAQTRKHMEAEDDIINEFQQYARAIAMGEELVKEKEKEIRLARDETKQVEDTAILTLINNTDLSDDAIAKTLEVPLEEVQRVRGKN